ncbi:MAG: hypothetical protein NTW03_02830, partial [Verrucomicrobia bacterium]|nr:hypothetical protein [Verrucomicrobiota bacterium]
PEGDRRRFEGGPRRPESGRRPDERGRGGPRGEDRPRRDFAPAPPEPVLEIKVSFRPDENGVDSLARQIKITGRAYPLFGVAQMILAKPERHTVTFTVKKGPDGQVLQPLFVCALDDTLCLSEQEAVDYALDKHFNTFYQAEKTAVEPPKGTYTFVAQCGMSGVILGPPNHHDYQNQLRKLHAERLSRVPFEVFQSRVKIVRDEPVIKKWLDDQSFRTEFVCLNMPEPLRLGSMEEVQKHFRENQLPIIVKQVESHTLTGAGSRRQRSAALSRLLRQAWEEQRRFPMQIATVLSQQFASRGLQFFKVNKNITHVAAARPHYLDLELSPVSDGIRNIVNFINAHPKCSRRHLLDALAPAPAPVPQAAPAVQAIAPAEAVPAVPEAAAPQPQPAPPAAPVGSSPEATMVISDLHWLIHQGHVIEFADGLLETAKKPVIRPPKPQVQPVAETPPGAPPSTAELAAEAAPQVPTDPVEAAPVESASTEAAPVVETLPEAQPAEPPVDPPATGAPNPVEPL